MLIQMHVNGSLQIELTAETPTERVILSEMADRAEKGKIVSMARKGDVVVVGVEH
jgi:hypothetical protein